MCLSLSSVSLGSRFWGDVLKPNLLFHFCHVSPQIWLLRRCTITDTLMLRSAAGTSTSFSATTLSSG